MSDAAEKVDGYLRLSTGGVLTRQSTVPTSPHGVVFVDIDDRRATPESLKSGFQDLPFRLNDCGYLLLRWPDVTADTGGRSEADLDARAQSWADALAGAPHAVGVYPEHVGVVRFRVGQSPVVVWAEDQSPPGKSPATPSAPDGDLTAQLLARARRAELNALMQFGHAVWNPTSYHYELPSGEHANSFVRIGDCFRNPRDVRVVSSWLASRLSDGLAVVADSATLIPLVTDLGALMTAAGWTPGPAEMLDEYPRTRLDVLRVVRPLFAAPAVLALLSVSSSGVYLNLVVESMQRASTEPDSWSLTVLADRVSRQADRVFRPVATGVDEERVDTWVIIGDPSFDQLEAAPGRLCRDPERAQVVRIDPRSFEAMVLPAVRLLMPDFVAARDTVDWWEACFKHGAVGVQVEPGQGAAVVARPKDDLLGVRIHVDRLLQADLGDALARRLADMRQGSPAILQFDGTSVDYSKCDGVIVSAEEYAQDGSNPVFDVLLQELSLSEIPVYPISPGLDSLPPDAADMHHALIISAGFVTGWTMRQHLLQLQDCWRGHRDRHAYGLILNARPFTHREWGNLAQSFRLRVGAIWRTYLPWRSPVAEESRILVELAAHAAHLTPETQGFLTERRLYTSPRTRDWFTRLDQFESDPSLPDPRALLWGSGSAVGGNTHVRNQSLYGYQVDVVTAYAAVGAAMHSSRQKVNDADPRRPVFEMPAITRSYYDAIIVASILRWAEPQECWWGNSAEEARSVVSELITRTTDDKDLKILLPELLLAASQGKMPTAAVQELRARADVIARTWSTTEQAPVRLGMELCRSSILAGRRHS